MIGVVGFRVTAPGFGSVVAAGALPPRSVLVVGMTVRNNQFLHAQVLTSLWAQSGGSLLSKNSPAARMILRDFSENMEVGGTTGQRVALCSPLKPEETHLGIQVDDACCSGPTITVMVEVEREPATV